LDGSVLVEIWSDVVCPWCYIGKRRFETALASFEHRDEVEVVWRSFELDPKAPQEREGDYASRLGRKYGMAPERAMRTLEHMTSVAAEEGLEFDFARSRSGNSFDAHRLLHFAGERGLQGELKERLLLAYFSEGEAIGRPEVLQRLAVEVGLDAGEVADVLAGEAYGDHVRADEEAAEELGVGGVPFFLVGRKFAVSGAQDVAVFTHALERAWAKHHPAIEVVGSATDAGACDDGSCAV
jgi:predicted DsbA family dithiol-disulfide isomerase